MQSPVGFMIREHFLHGVACFSFDRCVYACSGSEAKCLRDLPKVETVKSLTTVDQILKNRLKRDLKKK